jgi:hypothetical protein
MEETSIPIYLRATHEVAINSSKGGLLVFRINQQWDKVAKA